jgi:RNA polymerase sigma-70 factor, ECF subfamily
VLSALGTDVVLRSPGQGGVLRHVVEELRMPLASVPWPELGRELRSYVRRRVSNPADGDDIVQGVLLQLHRNLDRIRDTGKIPAWTRRAAERAVIDYYRSAHRRREVPMGAAGDLEPLSDPVSTDEPPPASVPLEDCVGPLVEELSAVYRAAIELTAWRGLRLREAASLADVSVSGMKSRLQRARRQLRQRLLARCDVTFARSEAACVSCQGQDPACGTSLRRNEA